MQEETNAVRRIRTTMIGAIAAIEKNFSEVLTTPELKQMFENARKDILDLGNKQIRNLKEEQ